MKRLLLPVSVILITFCCFPFAPVAEYSVTEKPKEEEIIGVYELSAQRVVDQNVTAGFNPNIEILSDGKCELLDLPVFVENDEYGFTFKLEKMYTGKCQWKLESIGSTKQNDKIVPVWGVCFNAEDFDSAVKCADITNNGKPYNLVFVFGDPDTNDVMSFERQLSK